MLRRQKRALSQSTAPLRVHPIFANFTIHSHRVLSLAMLLPPDTPLFVKRKPRHLFCKVIYFYVLFCKRVAPRYLFCKEFSFWSRWHWGQSNLVDHAEWPKIGWLKQGFGIMLMIFPRANSKTQSSLNSVQSGPRKFTKSDFSGLAPIRRVPSFRNNFVRCAIPSLFLVN